MTMVDNLEYVSNFLDKGELQSLKTLEDDERIAQRLETILSQGGGGQQRRALVVIQPGLETSSDLDVIVALLRRRNIVLILETTFGDVYDRSNVAFGVGAASPIVRLKVGPLKEEDCVNYVRERLRKRVAGNVDQAVVEIKRIELLVPRFLLLSLLDQTNSIVPSESEMVLLYTIFAAAYLLVEVQEILEGH